ncbi:hypothetical protein LJC36_04565 [Desulfovibrio sp. OttesenSCG-928-C14]|nr:hypothetical protein [Desulfovibrio sp. OttesenSCG-928-C14]
MSAARQLELFRQALRERYPEEARAASGPLFSALPGPLSGSLSGPLSGPLPGPDPKALFAHPFEAALAALIRPGLCAKADPGRDKGQAALLELRGLGVSSPAALAALAPDRLEKIIAPLGFAPARLARLRRLLEFFASQGGQGGTFPDDSGLEFLQGRSAFVLREDLLQIRGIGPESADFILLYALNLPVMPASGASWRILTRHGLVYEEAEYEEISSTLASSVQDDPAQYRELRELLLLCGRDYCKKNKMDCASCPLGPFMEY